jgi:Fur family ferric uptake transcriptional regulator
MSDDLRELKQRLRDAGLRATSARIAVLRALEAGDGPSSHAEVFESVAALGFDRATIYRNLVDLSDAGLARRTDHGDHVWRFELVGEDGHDAELHPHFVCNACGTVACLPEGALTVQGRRGIPRSLRRRDVEIQVRGLCDECG